MTFEEALRLRAGSWVIKASLTERRRASLLLQSQRS
jgi:hypothetical protein